MQQLEDRTRQRVAYIACVVVGMGSEDIAPLHGVSAATITADRAAKHDRWVDAPPDPPARA